MVTKGDKIVFALILVLAGLAFFFLKGRKSTIVQGAVAQEKSKSGKKGKEAKNADVESDNRISIVEKWNMPGDLTEISGISYIDNSRFACVQDEEGKIFIYNTATHKIEQEVRFGEPGDYEGIAVVGATAWVQRADGTLFEVAGYTGKKPAVVQHKTHLTAKQDVEGLCYDQKNNRLLLAIKGKEQDTKDYKGIYAFDLSSKKLGGAPVHKIDLTEKQSAEEKGKNKIQPSDLSIHPTSGDLYILDGPDSKLLVMGTDGTRKNLYALSTSDFPQPEGIDFSPAGELFISNEGQKGTGNIMKVLIGATP